MSFSNGSEWVETSEFVLEQLASSETVLVFLDVPLAKLLYGSLLDCVGQLLDRDKQVVVLRCTADLSYCFQNETNSRATCAACKSLTNDIESFFPVERRSRISVVESSSAEVDQKRVDSAVNELLADVNEIKQLRNLKFRGVEIGAGVISSLVQSYRERSVSWDEMRVDAARILRSAIQSFEIVEHVAKLVGAKSLLVGNGRFASTYGASAAAESLGIECFSLENPESRRGFRLVKARTIHDIHAFEEELLRLRSLVSSNRSQREIGLKFFVNQRYPQRKHQSDAPLASQDNHFLSVQRDGSLPADFDPSARNIVFFGSSMWEYEGLPGWESPFGMREKEVAGLASSHPDLDDSFSIWFREHPHAAILGLKEIQDSNEFVTTRLKVIPSGSTVDSYSLMQHAEKVVTFGSTIGIESVYWGRRSILCGVEPYQVLGLCDRPRTIDELVCLLNDSRSDSERDLESLAAYGLMRQQCGVRFASFSPISGTRGSLNGIPIRFSSWWRVMYEPKKRTYRRFLKIQTKAMKFFRSIARD